MYKEFLTVSSPVLLGFIDIYFHNNLIAKMEVYMLLNCFSITRGEHLFQIGFRYACSIYLSFAVSRLGKQLPSVRMFIFFFLSKHGIYITCFTDYHRLLLTYITWSTDYYNMKAYYKVLFSWGFSI